MWNVTEEREIWNYLDVTSKKQDRIQLILRRE